MSIKALSVPALIIAGLIVLLSNPEVRTGVRDAAVAAGIAVAVYVVSALPFGIADVWDQSYSYHQDCEADRDQRSVRSTSSSTRSGTATSSCSSRSRSP